MRLHCQRDIVIRLGETVFSHPVVLLHVVFNWCFFGWKAPRMRRMEEIMFTCYKNIFPVGETGRQTVIYFLLLHWIWSALYLLHLCTQSLFVKWRTNENWARTQFVFPVSRHGSVTYEGGSNIACGRATQALLRQKNCDFISARYTLTSSFKLFVSAPATIVIPHSARGL